MIPQHFIDINLSDYIMYNTKNNLKWIINLNVKPKATKILDKNHGRKYLLPRDKQRFLKQALDKHKL